MCDGPASLRVIRVPLKSSKGTIKDVVEMTLEGLSLLEDVIKGASQFI